MKTGIKILVYGLAYLPSAAFPFWPFTSQQPLTEAEEIALLQEEQASSPYDPEINYNLGVALYKNKQFDPAKNNFERALASPQAKKFPEFLQRCLFNAGNSGYKHTIKTLPQNWKQDEAVVPDDSLKTAIETVKQSIAHFKESLKLKPRAQTEKNKKKAEELLKQLEEKQKKQQQNKPKDDQNKDKGNEEKDSGNGDKSNDTQNDKESKDKKEVGYDKGEGQQDKRDSGGQEGGDSTPQPSPDGNDNCSENKNKKDKEHRDTDQHDQPPSASPPQPSQAEHTQTPTEKQENKKNTDSVAVQQQKQSENMHDKSMRALLESLDADATQKHKDLLMRKTKEQNQPLEGGQRPW